MTAAYHLVFMSVLIITLTEVLPLLPDEASGGSDDWAANLNITYVYTFELRDVGQTGFLLPETEILPTVSTVLPPTLRKSRQLLAYYTKTPPD